MIKGLDTSVWEKNSYFLFLSIAAIILMILAPRAAVNVDEQLHYPHAKNVVNWYFTGGEDKSCLHTPVTNLKYYGQSVDNFTALFNRIFRIEKEFLVRHYTGAIFFWLLLFFSGELARKVSGSELVAVITVMSLVFMPRLAGHAFGNLKDIPFATGYMAGLLMIVKFLKEFPVLKWKTALLLGVAIAFTVSVRAGGLILFGYLGLATLFLFVLKPFYLMQIVSTKPVFLRLLGQMTAILIIGYFGGLLSWPFALQNVFMNPFESLRVMEHYQVSIRQIFEGEWVWSTQLPWYYLAKWLLISSPVFLLCGFLIYLAFFIRETFHFKQQTLIESLILLSFLFPFIYVIAIKSNLYSGIRQMIFILPSMAFLAVFGIFKLINVLNEKSKSATYIVMLCFLFMLLWPVKHQASTFPVDYVYFNFFAGGNKNAWSNYEYDYYFHSMKDPVEYVIQLAEGKDVVVAMNCNLSNYFDAHPNIEYVYTRYLERSTKNWDFAVLGLNYLHPYLLKNNLWQTSETVQTFYHKGNPVAILLERKDKSDFDGLSEIKNGNLQKGIALLKSALEKDSTNVWLYVHLANAKHSLGDSLSFKYLVDLGKNIYPFFEPLYLLEINYLKSKGMNEEAYKKLEYLLQINPRYLPAKELYEELNMKN